MSKLAHSHQPTMDEIDRKRAILDGNEDLIENREVKAAEQSQGAATALSAHELGYAAWNEDVAFHNNPFEWSDPQDADAWDEGWLAAQADNSQFGVGA